MNTYKHHYLPKNLSFDEETLFWRLRMGEGIPQREWHKPLDRTKNWHEIKLSLDKKLQTQKTNALFQKIHPKNHFFVCFIKKFIRSIKRAFLLKD